jgi:hypothetical protein
MKNKTLEGLLKKGHGSIIKLIEKCEEGRVIEIRITKEEGLTSDQVLDKRVMSYLRRLKVKVTVITEQEYLKAKNKFYKSEAQCTDPVHSIADGDGSKKDKLELLQGNNLFRIDTNSFATCKECFKILPILGD